MMTRILAGSALALMLAMPGAMAQTPDTPPAPPATVTPAPTDTPPATVTPPSPVDATPPTAPQSTASETPAPQPASKKSNRFRIGPEVGVYFLTSGKARSQFGNSAISLGLGLGSIAQASTRGRVALDLQVQYQTRSGNHMFLAPLGVAYRLSCLPRITPAAGS